MIKYEDKEYLVEYIPERNSNKYVFFKKVIDSSGRDKLQLVKSNQEKMRIREIISQRKPS